MSADPFQSSWSVVRAALCPAGRATSHRWARVWTRLCESYRPVMEAHVRRTLSRTGGPVRLDAAEEIVQAFLVECVRDERLLREDARIGALRGFLCVCLKRYAVRHCLARRAGRRGTEGVSLGAVLEGVDPDREETDAAFSRDWTRRTLEHALARVRRGRPADADVLHLLLTNPERTAPELSALLQIDRSLVPLRRHRAKETLVREFWRAVKETVSSEAELETERRALEPFLMRRLSPGEAAPQ